MKYSLRVQEVLWTTNTCHRRPERSCSRNDWDQFERLDIVMLFHDIVEPFPDTAISECFRAHANTGSACVRQSTVVSWQIRTKRTAC